MTGVRVPKGETGRRSEAGGLPSFAEAVRVWGRIGCLSFGGPAGQIALLHREVVEERRWIGERRFLHALNFCTLLPGPEAQQLATYLGWLMHGVKGGVAAGVLFVVPGAAVMLALSVVYAVLGDVPVVGAVFFGLKSAVLLLVVEALLRIGRRALKGGVAWGVAGTAFVGLFLFGVPFPLVVLGAGLVGLVLPGAFAGGARGKEGVGVPALLDAVLESDPGRAGRMARGARTGALVAGVAWVAPVLALLPLGGVFGDVAWFFSKMAVVTFGGAYAVLAYVAQEAVQGYHWVSAPEMLTGLGLAETTPGPLILVLQFVGFLAGYRAPGELTGVMGGVAASVLTLWVTFAPCFVFVFLGAPLIERLQGNRLLAGALAAVTAGVVGVIGNLTVWFAVHSLFRATVPVRWGWLAFDAPVWGSLDVWGVGLAVLAWVVLLGMKKGVVWTLGVCATGSVVLHLGFGLL